MTIATAGSDQDRPSWESRRLWSLWDMIGYLHGVLHIHIDHIELLAGLAMAIEGTSYTKDKFIKDCHKTLSDTKKTCDEYELMGSSEYIDDFDKDLDIRTEISAISHELTTIVKLLKQEASHRLIFCIKKEKGDILEKNMRMWEPIIDAFPSADPELLEAIKSYQFELNNACVFHLMRVAEYGLRALARERSVSFPTKPVEWAHWQDLLTQIDRSVDAQWAKASAGPAKDAALGFYKGALAHFHAFKDKYRNAVMHVRKRYDEHEALQALTQVRDFMAVLSAKIGEKTRSPIRKWP